MPGLRQHKRRLVELVGRDFVSNVNNAYPWRNAENHTFHRAHEVIGVSEVGGQSDEQGTLSPDHSRIVRVVEPGAHFSGQLARGWLSLARGANYHKGTLSLWMLHI